MLELASHISRRCSAHAQVHSMTIVSKVVQCALLHVADVADIQISDEMLEEVTEEMGNREVVDLAYPVGNVDNSDDDDRKAEQEPLHVNVVDMCERVFEGVQKAEGGIRRFEQSDIFLLSAMAFILSHL